MQPLEGVKVLEFSTLLPGPMAPAADRNRNYIGVTALLTLSADTDGAPIAPPAPTAKNESVA